MKRAWKEGREGGIVRSKQDARDVKGTGIGMEEKEKGGKVWEGREVGKERGRKKEKGEKARVKERWGEEERIRITNLMRRIRKQRRGRKREEKVN